MTSAVDARSYQTASSEEEIKRFSEVTHTIASQNDYTLPNSSPTFT